MSHNTQDLPRPAEVFSKSPKLKSDSSSSWADLSVPLHIQECPDSPEEWKQMINVASPMKPITELQAEVRKAGECPWIPLRGWDFKEQANEMKVSSFPINAVIITTHSEA